MHEPHIGERELKFVPKRLANPEKARKKLLYNLGGEEENQ